MLDFKNKPSGFIKSHLKRVGIFVFEQDGNYECFPPYREAEAQEIIDRVMPDLIPVQFHFLLAKYGFDDVIDSLLISLKDEDIDKYAMYKAYLNSARFYEFDKALIMFNEILDKFTAINPDLALSESQLRAMWMEASQV